MISMEDFSSVHQANLSPPKFGDPRSKYNFLSRLLFLWVDGLFYKGCRQEDLSHSDLYAHPSEADSERLHKKFDRYWSHELKRREEGRKPRLWMTIVKCYWWRFMVQGTLVLLEIVFLLGQSILLGYLTRYFSLPKELRAGKETRNAYLYGASLVLLGILVSFTNAHNFFIGQKVGMMCRIMMISAVYKKILSLSQVTIGQKSIGHIVNIASNDVQRFDQGFLYVHFLWVSPIYVSITAYLIYREIGWAAFVCVALVVIQVPFNVLLAKMFAKIRLKSAKLTDKRIRVMNEVITGIRVIKMYAWEYAFKRLVSAIRRHETLLIKYGGLLRVLTVSFQISGSLQVMVGVSIFIFVATGGELTTQRVFTTLSLLSSLNSRSGINLVVSFFYLYEVTVALLRIQTLLLLEESQSIQDKEDSKRHRDIDEAVFSHQVTNTGYFRPESPYLSRMRINLEDSPVKVLSHMPDVYSSPTVHVSCLSASWSNKQEDVVLRGISFELNSSAPLLGIVGPVGAGKSTLLQCLLGELRALEGTVEVNGRLSYASQDPWVFSGSVRENILFGLPYQEEWYDKVIDACALRKDIGVLASGDLTLVGERGVTLSGGQKARVNLARAIYHDADIYLLDDPLSAVDTAVGKHLFNRCIRGILKEKLVILVTHQVHFAIQTSKLLALKDGEVCFNGNYSNLSNGKVSTLQFLGLKNEVDEFVCKNLEDDRAYNTTSKSLLVRKNRADGLSSALSSVSSLHSEMGITHESENVHPLIPVSTEEKAHGSVSMKTYIGYFRAGGNSLILFILLLSFLLGEGSVIVTDWWLSEWASCTESDAVSSNRSDRLNSSTPVLCTVPENSRHAAYGILLLFCVLLNLLRGGLFFLVCLNASTVLHNRMFKAILQAPILFFDTNPSGRVLNRFSKDIGFLDDLLPRTFLTYLLLMLHFVAIVIVASVANPYILIPLPLVMAVFLALRWYFLKTSRSIKRLEAIARSPIYSHISATLQGLTTIRVLKKQAITTRDFHAFNNEHTQGWYLNLVIARWFGMRLDLLSIFVLAVVVFSSIPLLSQTDELLDPSLLGLGLTYLITLVGSFEYCIRKSTDVENIMISTERVMAYGILESEAPLETLNPQQKPPPDWPSRGEIHFKDVAFQYSPQLPLVLENLSFTVKPSEKVGIVGRTGAGKSSLLSVLYRLAEPFGHITIDGVDIKSIGLHDLRKKMSIIPQDPVLFSGTMRYNLDPFEEYSDSALWESLEQVQLKRTVEELEGQLSGEVCEGGSNFSVGQRQLVCLARALLRRNKILILDEATANVDLKTDDIIQKAIRDKFSDCTVLTIAHRLNTIMDSDRILVMNNGKVREFASPCSLLQNPSSRFFKMVEKTGPEASQKLHQMAADASKLKQSQVA